MLELGHRLKRLAGEHDQPIVHLDVDCLMTGRMPRGWHDADAGSDLRLAIEQSVRGAGEVHPFRDRKSGPERGLILGPLHVDGDAEEASIVAAVIEMEMRVDDGRDIAT